MINLNKITLNKLFHIIYYEWHLDIRAGGPTGYLANLLDGLNRIENNNNPLIFFDVLDKQSPVKMNELTGLRKMVREFFYGTDNRKKFYINHVSKYQKIMHNNYVNYLRNVDGLYCRGDLFDLINLDTAKTIHAHTVGDAIKLHNSLVKAHVRKNVKLILTSHTPEVPSDEYYKDYLAQGQSVNRAEEIRDLWRKVEKSAFEHADILVFPSKEAMEPLEITFPSFEDIIKGKYIRFIQSGAKKLIPTLTKEEAKRKYGVAEKFVVGYIGRHNEIKGYDILEQAAKSVIAQDANICFLIGGAQGGTFLPLKNKEWTEAGWVNPADMLMAIDVFVLPNRMTYFDLVLLEVMSMGIPVIASFTGGNKTVKQITDSLILYNNTPEDLAKAILAFKRMPIAERQEHGKKLKQAYELYYTPEIFATRYLELVNDIYRDYHFI